MCLMKLDSGPSPKPWLKRGVSRYFLMKRLSINTTMDIEIISCGFYFITLDYNKKIGLLPPEVFSLNLQYIRRQINCLLMWLTNIMFREMLFGAMITSYVYFKMRKGIHRKSIGPCHLRQNCCIRFLLLILLDTRREYERIFWQPRPYK